MSDRYPTATAAALPPAAPLRAWPRRLLRTLAAIAIGYTLVCAGLYAMQDWLVFPATRFTAEVPRRATNLEAIALPRGDGVVLRGLLRKPLQALQAKRPVILYFGGNAEEVTWWATYAGWPPNWAVVLVNYRGYGASNGKPAEAPIYADALALYDWARARPDIDAERIVLFGRSLGAGVATYVASERTVRGIVLTAPFDSVVAVARGMYPWVPVEWLLRYRFDSVVRAPALQQPLLMLVTPADRTVPIEHSERLFAAWGGTDKTIIRLPDTSHSEIASGADYWQAVRSFIDRVK